MFLKKFIKLYPSLTYFFLVFFISWGGLLISGNFPPDWTQFEKLGITLYLGILAGPSLSSILLTGIIDGKEGFRNLFVRCSRWRLEIKWYALALLPALLMAMTFLLLSFISHDFRPAIIESNNKIGIIMLALGPSLFFGFFEEIGWTGFVVPQLLHRHGIAATGLLVGIVWGAWHFPLFWEGNTFSALLPLSILLARLFSWLPAFRVLMVWIYVRTESLFVIAFMHATLVMTQLILIPKSLAGGRLLIHILVMAGILWLLLVVITISNHGNLSQQSETKKT